MICTEARPSEASEFTYFCVLIFPGVVGGGLPVLVGRDVCPVLDQPPDDVDVALGGGEVERCGLVAVVGVDADVLILNLKKKKPDTNGSIETRNARIANRMNEISLIYPSYEISLIYPS